MSEVNGSSSKRAEGDEYLLIWQGTKMTGIGGIGLVLHMRLSLPCKSPVELPAMCSFRWALTWEWGTGTTTRNWKPPELTAFSTRFALGRCCQENWCCSWQQMLWELTQDFSFKRETTVSINPKLKYIYLQSLHMSVYVCMLLKTQLQADRCWLEIWRVRIKIANLLITPFTALGCFVLLDIIFSLLNAITLSHRQCILIPCS